MACIRLFDNKTRKSQSVALHHAQTYSIHRYAKGHMGTQGYYLSPRAAGRLVAYAQNWYLPIDLYMDAFCTHDVESLGVNPALVVRRDAMTARTGSTRGRPSLKEKLTKEAASMAPQAKRCIHNSAFQLKLATKRIRGLDDR